MSIRFERIRDVLTANRQLLIVLAIIIASATVSIAADVSPMSSSASIAEETPIAASKILQPLEREAILSYLNSSLITKADNETEMDTSIKITRFQARPESPQPVGTKITFTVDATDPLGNNLSYVFILNGEPVTSWREDSSWIWNPTQEDIGTNNITVYVRDNISDSAMERALIASRTFRLANSQLDFEVYENHAPIITTILATPKSPQEPGTQVNFTAVATDSDNDTIWYIFYLDDRMIGEGTPLPSWIWRTTTEDLGEHRITVTAYDHHGKMDNYSINYTIYQNQEPIISTIEADPTGPVSPGVLVTFRVNASDPEEDALMYKFLLDENPATGWVNQPYWTWNTTGSTLGTHLLEVRVKDYLEGYLHGNEYISSSTNYTLQLNEKPTISNLSASPIGPWKPGTTVTFTALASDPEQDEIEYMYLLDDVPLTNWTNSSSIQWVTPQIEELGGSLYHAIEVRVREKGHDKDEYTSKLMEFALKEPAEGGAYAPEKNVSEEDDNDETGEGFPWPAVVAGVGAVAISAGGFWIWKCGGRFGKPSATSKKGGPSKPSEKPDEVKADRKGRKEDERNGKDEKTALQPKITTKGHVDMGTCSIDPNSPAKLLGDICFMGIADLGTQKIEGDLKIEREEEERI